MAGAMNVVVQVVLVVAASLTQVNFGQFLPITVCQMLQFRKGSYTNTNTLTPATNK